MRNHDFFLIIRYKHVSFTMFYSCFRPHSELLKPAKHLNTVCALTIVNYGVVWRITTQHV